MSARYDIGFARNEGPPDEPLCRTHEEIAADLLALPDFRRQMVADAYQGCFGDKCVEAYERGGTLKDVMETAAQDYLSELIAWGARRNNQPEECELQDICEAWGVNRYE